MSAEARKAVMEVVWSRQPAAALAVGACLDPQGLLEDQFIRLLLCSNAALCWGLGISLAEAGCVTVMSRGLCEREGFTGVFLCKVCFCVYASTTVFAVHTHTCMCCEESEIGTALFKENQFSFGSF